MFNNSIKDYDCNNIHLTKEYKKYFKTLLTNQTIILPRTQALVLSGYGLADIVNSDNSTITLKLTEFGKIYKEYQKDKIKNYILSGTKDWLAIAISVIALIVSIFK